MSPREVLVALGRASLEGGVLLLLLWAATRLWPRMPAAARRWLWWLGSLRLAVGLAPIPRYVLSLQPSWNQAAAAATTEASARVAAIGEAIATPLAATREVVAGRAEVWWLALLVLWLLGVLVSLGTMAWRLFQLGRRWRAAAPFTDRRIARWRAEWALALGTARTPEIRVGAGTHAPLALGLGRPGILLPAGAERLSDDALRLVLAHELSHLRRRDPLLGWLPAIAEALFWFHPLARLSSREYLSAREELCDADALRATRAAPRDYGELLLDFAVGRHSVLPGCASCGTPAGRRLKRRLEMLSNQAILSWPKRLAVSAFGVAFVLISFAPVRLSAHENGLEMNGSMNLSGKASPMSYMIKTAGQKGTRGSIDLPMDLAAARALDRWNRTALYFRFGNERWITYDAQAIAEARKACEIEDAYDAKDQEFEQRQRELDRRQEQLESRWETLQSRKDALQDRKSELDDQAEQLRDAGKSTAGVEAEKQRVLRQLEALSDPMDELSRARANLSKDMKEIERQDKVRSAERDAASRRTMAEIERIGLRAIARGAAESYGAGGSSAESQREGRFRFFLPPDGQIW